MGLGRPSWVGIALLAGGLTAGAAEVRVATRDELIAALQSAQAGTTIRMAPGEYRGGIAPPALQGTAEAPIVLAGDDPRNPPVFRGGSFAFQLSSPQHVELRDLVVDGATSNGLNIDDSGSNATPARQVTLRNLVVRNVGPDGNRDGVKLSGVYGFRLEGCRIETWGSGGSAIDMVGCHAGVISRCTIRQARSTGATGVQAKGGSSDIAIRRCRFDDAGGRAVNAGGSTGLPFFRPADATAEASRITIEDCELLGGDAAIAFVGVDGAIARHNTIYRPRRWAVRILQETTAPRFTPCRNGEFVNNVVVFRSDELRQAVNVGPHTAAETFTLAGNVWYCVDRPAETERLARLELGESQGVYGRDPELRDPAAGDVSVPDGTWHRAGVRPEAGRAEREGAVDERRAK